MPRATSFPIYIAAENKDYNVSLQTLISGDAYTISKDAKLVFNPVTGLLKLNGIKFPQVEQTAVGLPRSAQTYLDSPAVQSIPALTLADISGLQASIKPSSVNSKILIVVRWFGELSSANSVWNSMFGLKRNGSPIGNPVDPGVRHSGMASNTGSYNHGGDADSTPEVVQYYYIDSPGTESPVNYQATVLCLDAQTFYTNRVVNATDSASYERGTSSIFLMELI